MQEQDRLICLRIKELINHLHISQANFSRQTGIDAGNLSRILATKIAAGPITVNKIILAFNVNRQWIEEGKGEMFSCPSEEDTENYATVLHSAIDIIERQTKLLEAKEKQIDKLIEIINQKFQTTAHPEDSAGCADASGF